MSSIANSNFDYVIVGGGTAGLVLAARLSEDPNAQVLVLETGADLSEDARVNVPAMWQQLQSGETDWQLKTVPQVSRLHTSTRRPPHHVPRRSANMLVSSRKPWATGSL